jgi:ABC-type multidrug transport system ATPase subunit
MRINLSNAGKRFNREWIFRNVNLQFDTSLSYAITGPNGSGKSTLLQCIGGMFQLSEGSISFSESDLSPNPNNPHPAISPENAYRHLSFCAPYSDVIEEMTLVEFMKFHSRFKPFLKSYSIPLIIEEIGLAAAAQKQIRFYSSGMKQRVRLAQAIFSDVPIVLLDEPCSNLDAKGIELYQSLISSLCRERLLIVCSNDEVEYRFCQKKISIMDYKNAVLR